MSDRFFTNSENNSLINKFEGIFEAMSDLKYFDVLVGYFRASGYFKVRKFTDKIEKVRILVGINVDKLTKQYHEKGLLLLDDAEETKAEFVAELTKNIQEANYDKETEEGIIQFLDDLASGKIEMRAHPTKTIHAKLYIFRRSTFNEHNSGQVITGSSNLTDAGIGAVKSSNYEFNVSISEYTEVKFAQDEFDELWKESREILQAEADKIKKNTYLRDDFSPHELYIKMLMEYFGKRVEYDPYNIDLLLPDKYFRLKYQSDAANHGYSILQKHNGFLLADVVGLGKTIIACMVAKKFIFDNGVHTKVLVVVPPALKSGWQRTVADFQVGNHCYYVTTGSLAKVLDENNGDYPNASLFDLIIVDESHKFRNDGTNMYTDLQNICKRPRQTPGIDGDTRKKVMLLSATPMNNRPKDIESQLYLFLDKRNSGLPIRNLQEYFKSVNEQYKKLSEAKQLDKTALKKLFEQLRNDIIEPLVIRRTRTDIENREYLEDLEKQGIKFPKVGDPEPMYYKLKGGLSGLFLETVSLITGLDEQGEKTEGLGYYRYRAIEFLMKDSDREMYGNVRSISERLSGIMRTLLVKRLESSFFAFKQSLLRLQQAIENMLVMFANDQVFVAPGLDVNKLIHEGYTEDEIAARVENKGGNNRIFSASDFDSQFIELLKQDKAKVDALIGEWNKEEKDPKLSEFSRRLKDVFFRPEYNHGNKLVIFTEAKETAEKLAERIKNAGRKKPLVVSADNRNEVEKQIRENFDANLEEEKWRDDHNIIITTEVLAEGVNLHRSNVIVNYDVPWNATRLMQRIGRVNRIGSRADKVHVFNFYPSAEGDQQINLVNTALRKLQAFHTAFGEDNKIFSVLEEKGESALFGSKIQEETNEIQNYLNELRDFKKQNPKQFRKIEKIPNKARCGRTAKGRFAEQPGEGQGLIQYPLAGCAVAYLKSQNHAGIFCLVKPNSEPVELSFLQAVKIYKAEAEEQPISLPTLHHEQTLAAFDFFKKETVKQNARNAKAHNLSPVEKAALSNLKGLLKDRDLDKEKKQILKRFRKQIEEGVFVAKGLPREINTFIKKEMPGNKDNALLLDKLIAEVLNKYDTPSDDEENSKEETHRILIEPKIVLSQSFD